MGDPISVFLKILPTHASTMASNRARKIDKHRQFMGNKMMDDISLYNEINSSPFYDRNKISSISLMDIANISESWLQVKREYIDICEANIFLASRKFGEKTITERLDILLEYRFQQMQNSFKPVTLEMPAVEETVLSIDFTVSSDENNINVKISCTEDEPPRKSPDMVLTEDTSSLIIDNFSHILKFNGDENLPNSDNAISPIPDVISEEPVLGFIESHDLGRKRGLITKRSIPSMFIDSNRVSGIFIKKREKWQEELKALDIPPMIRLLVDDQPLRKEFKTLTQNSCEVKHFTVKSNSLIFGNLSQHYHAHNYGGRKWKGLFRGKINQRETDLISDGFISNLARCSVAELIRYKHLIKGYIDNYAAHICYIKKILPKDKSLLGRGMAPANFLS